MAEDHSEMVLRGAATWNTWRDQNRQLLTFSAPNWYHNPDRAKGRNDLDFSGMNLSGVEVYHAFAEGLNLCNSTFENSHFEEGDFSRANFNGATFRNTRFNKTILTGASFEDATFVNCNLNRVNLVGAAFRVKEITETVVYGISAWDMATSDDMKQSRLVIEKTYELYSELIQHEKIPLMVDDIELAQFVYYLSNHKKMRTAINVLTRKGVLLLGRFKDGGLERLYTIRDWLRGKGYMAMIFDFDRPDSLSMTGTVVTMAGLAKFVIADLSGPSVPHELKAILDEVQRPVLAFGKPYAMFRDVADRAPVRLIKGSDSNLLQALEDTWPEMEKLHTELTIELAKRDHDADE